MILREEGKQIQEVESECLDDPDIHQIVHGCDNNHHNSEHSQLFPTSDNNIDQQLFTPSNQMQVLTAGSESTSS